MNYKALDRQELENLARATFGEVLRYERLEDREIIGELEAYDRFVKKEVRGGGGINEILPDKRNAS